MITQEQIQGFLSGAQSVINAYFAEHLTRLTPPTLEAMEGKKYIRVVSVGPGQRSAWCFLDRETGDILKCDGWKRPAKHARGHINTPRHGAEFVGPYGPAYLTR